MKNTFVPKLSYDYVIAMFYKKSQKQSADKEKSIFRWRVVECLPRIPMKMNERRSGLANYAPINIGLGLQSS